MINLLIDTSGYISSGLDFSSSKYKSLRDFIDQGYVYAYGSPIIIEEIKKEFNKKIEEDFSRIRNIKLNPIVKNNCKEFVCLSPFTKEEISITNIFDNNVKDLLNHIDCLVSEELDSYNNVNVKKIFENYFQKEPPFVNDEKDPKNSKRYEFPDAFILESLVNKITKQPCYIVAKDGDWKKFCEKYDNLLYLEKLEDFLDICNREQEALSEKIIKCAKNKKEEIINAIKMCVEDTIFYISPDFNVINEDYFLHSINDIFIDDYKIVEINDYEKSSILSVECTVNMDVSVTGDDCNTGWYDKEDGLYRDMDKITYDCNVVRNFDFEIHISYSDNTEQSEVTFVDGGEPITIEYTDYDPEYPLYK